MSWLVSRNRHSVVASAVLAMVGGLVGGILLLSWLGPLWAKLALMGIVFVSLLVANFHRGVVAVCFMTTAGVITAGGSLMLSERPDTGTVTVGLGLLVLGLAFAVAWAGYHRRSRVDPAQTVRVVLPK